MVLTFPFVLLSLLFELALSRRGLAVAALLVAAGFSLSTWLRPPLSKDIRGLQLPVGLTSESSLIPDDATAVVDRTSRRDSLATALLLVIGVGLIAVVVEPKWLHIFSGLLVALGIAAVGATTMNHPAVIESLDREFEQRKQIHSILGTRSEELLAATSGARVYTLESLSSPLAPLGAELDDPFHGWMYIVYGPWLVAFCLLVTLFSMQGSRRRRIVQCTLWVLMGFVLSGVITSRRWVAEYHLADAQRLENENAFDAAVVALDDATEVLPSFAQTRRFWLIQGRIDQRRGAVTPHARYFKIHQHYLNGEPEAARSMAALLLLDAPESRVVRDFAAQISTQLGKIAFFKESENTAQHLWTESTRIAPWHLDCQFGLATTFARLHRKEPDLVESSLAIISARLGDRMLLSDIDSMIGDAYFDAGRFEEAREHYAASMETYSLPRTVNPHALEGLLGM